MVHWVFCCLFVSWRDIYVAFLEEDSSKTVTFKFSDKVKFSGQSALFSW